MSVDSVNRDSMLMPKSIDWSPGFGDPTLVGWLTVAGYAAAIILCGVAARSDRHGRNAWVTLGILELLLGINKQLDLQVLFVETARYVAKLDDWYDDRRTVQVAFVVAIAVSFIVLLAIIHRKAIRQTGPVRLALVGAAIQLVFVCLRAASLNHMDAYLGTRFGGVMPDMYLEQLGIFITAIGAASAIRAAWARQG